MFYGEILEQMSKMILKITQFIHSMEVVVSVTADNGKTPLVFNLLCFFF